jgi:hypothetical protein
MACFGAFSPTGFSAGGFDIDSYAQTDDALGKIATEYREAESFIKLIISHLTQIEAAARAACAIPDYFDLRTARGEQLTFIGKRLGWPRQHCICVTLPVLGFEWDEPPPGVQIPIAGNCEGATFIDCGATGRGEASIDDDDLYRRFLMVRRYQFLNLYDIASLQTCVKLMWGPSATIHDAARGQVVLAPGRDLTGVETTLLQLALRVMPVAPGIRPMMQFGSTPILGFGEGWAGNCEAAQFLCPVFIDPYACAA